MKNIFYIITIFFISSNLSFASSSVEKGVKFLKAIAPEKPVTNTQYAGLYKGKTSCEKIYNTDKIKVPKNYNMVYCNNNEIVTILISNTKDGTNEVYSFSKLDLLNFQL